MHAPFVAIDGFPRLGPALDRAAYFHIRRQMVLHHLKWDAQVGDESTLLDQPLILTRETWQVLAATTEKMANEVVLLERELLGRPGLQRLIGVPSALQSVLRRWVNVETTPAPRILRFDFHPTTEGWKVSEVNSDVPGGFTESSALTALVAQHCPGAHPSGDPLNAWRRSIKALPSVDRVGILYAAGYLEDQQIASLLGRSLSQVGCQVEFLQSPQCLEWRGAKALFRDQPLDVIIRFYQGEWLAALPKRMGWAPLFSPTETVVTNPACSVLSESKRMPLAWGHIPARVPTLIAMFAECREPKEVDPSDEKWVFKAGYSNNGDSIVIPGLLSRKARGEFLRKMRWHSRQWVAQRRFHCSAVETQTGIALYPCLGIYTVNGVCAGCYVRLSRGPVIDYRALEAALLISDGPEAAA